VAAVRNEDDVNFCEELGDVFLLVVMHAAIAREEERFDINDVIVTITEKLVRRHPHVFGTSTVRDSAGVVRQWNTIKSEEKKERKGGYLDEVGAALPALMRAQKLQKKAAQVNFDWSDVGDVIAKVHEELAETKHAIASRNSEAIADEIGDLLFAVVNLARKSGLDAESVLQAATDKFVERFNRLESELEKKGRKLGEAQLPEMDAIWNRLKDSAPTSDDSRRSGF
jgi:MazG family protein